MASVILTIFVLESPAPYVCCSAVHILISVAAPQKPARNVIEDSVAGNYLKNLSPNMSFSRKAL